MARLSKAARVTTDLVQEFLTSPATRQMILYAEMAGPNPVSRAADDLRRGRAAVVDSALLPSEIAGEFHDRGALTSVRVRLQRGKAPEVVDDRAPAVVDDVEEPTADTVPLEVAP